MSTLKHSISQDKVKQLTSNYEKNKTKILKKKFHGEAILPTSETFDRAAFDQLLSQEGCVGVRIYFGMDEDLKVQLVVVGVNEKGQNLRPSTSKLKKIEDSDVVTEPVFAFSGMDRCPPDCPPPDDPTDPE